MNFTDFLTQKGQTQEKFDALDVNEQAAIFNEYNAAEKARLEEAMENKASKEDIQKLEKSIADNYAKQFEALNKAVANLATSKVQSKENKILSFKDAFSQTLKDKKEDIENFLSKGADKVRLTVKSPVSMGNFNTVEASGSASQTSITQDTGIISPLRKRILNYFEGVSTSLLTVDEPFLMWIEELDEQGAPLFIGENTTTPEASVRYEERVAKAKTVAVSGRVTKDMLRYSNSLFNYVQNNLLKRLDIVTEDGLFKGDGTGDNLKGLVTYATSFDGGVGTKGGDGLLNSFTAPTNWDVLKAVALQVANSYGNASVLYVDSDKLAEMETSKDSNGNYIMPPFKSADGTLVSGMRLIPITLDLGSGIDFVGGDMSAVNVGMLLDTEIEIGRNSTDLKDRKFTIVLEKQLVQFVSANDTQVLVKGGFTAGKALLTTT